MVASNLLDSISTGFLDGVILEQIGMAKLNWIGKIIQWLIEGVGIVGLGIILFTLILKTIVLPLDVYSRIKTKKQSLMMEKMRPQMEKLQKQYANDKQMYSQKVMELQKQNGFSMFGACLPMIVSLVIFMVVFSAFSTYSQYANLSSYNNMVDAYNETVQEFVYSDENGTTVHDDGFLIGQIDESTGRCEYLVDFDKFIAHYEADTSEDKLKVPEGYDNLTAYFETLNESGKKECVGNYIRVTARKSSAAYYRDNKTGFLWVGNIWYPDSLLNKEVPSFSKFSSSISRAVGSGIDGSYEASYNEVVADLGSERGTYNGYFVLIVLAIGIMFLQQFIMMRSQKAANDLSTVDGSGARTTKWMMIMMPVIYGIFSFFYSAAFSIYMITNTLFSLATTLIINKVLDVTFKKREERRELEHLSKRNSKNRKRLK